MRFRGGVAFPRELKPFADRPITGLPEPAEVLVPLYGGPGKPCRRLVERGERVEEGAVIGEGDAELAAVHATVTGTVTRLETCRLPAGDEWPAVRIRRGESAAHGQEGTSRAPAATLPDLACQMGILGLGGAAFPLHRKLRLPAGAQVDDVILNGAECEPCLSGDYRLLLERTAEILAGGLRILAHFRAKRLWVGIEQDRERAIAAVRRATGGGRRARVFALPARYPQGAEKQLVRTVLGREIPRGVYPWQTGVSVHNVGTALAVSRAMAGQPLLARVVTVAGEAVREPGNYLVKIGASLAWVLEQVGLKERPEKLLVGGPMMGFAQADANVPVTKGTTGILALTAGEWPQPTPCVRCSACVEACPAGLLPLYLEGYTLKGLFAQAAAHHPGDCIECGACSYVCPAHRPLVQSIRWAKRESGRRSPVA